MGLTGRVTVVSIPSMERWDHGYSAKPEHWVRQRGRKSADLPLRLWPEY